jgi:hypothetical protein
MEKLSRRREEAETAEEANIANTLAEADTKPASKKVGVKAGEESNTVDRSKSEEKYISPNEIFHPLTTVSSNMSSISGSPTNRKRTSAELNQYIRAELNTLKRSFDESSTATSYHSINQEQLKFYDDDLEEFESPSKKQVYSDDEEDAKLPALEIADDADELSSEDGDNLGAELLEQAAEMRANTQPSNVDPIGMSTSAGQHDNGRDPPTTNQGNFAIGSANGDSELGNNPLDPDRDNAQSVSSHSAATRRSKRLRKPRTKTAL